MLRFLHGYMDNYWQGLVRHGMIDDTSGVKLHQHIDVPENMCFNEYAKLGGELYETVRECSRPFYVDRLQGGWWYKKYDFDFDLVRKYDEMCGEWMLGFQLHEWASNMASDWYRIWSRSNGNIEYTEKAIANAAYMESHTPGVKRSWFESASAAEYAALRKPETVAEAIAQFRALLNKRSEETQCHLIPADSAFMALRWEIEAGARALMPEIGGQIPNTRIQLAVTRGIAKAAGIKWGTYYEPWGGEPFGCAYYKRDLHCEWYIKSLKSDLFGCFSYSPDSGSSRHLQKRIYYLTLLSGADLISEEYGTCNTFYDWNEFELTPYGKIKRDFISFMRRFPGDAVPYTPIAVVIPREFEVFDLSRGSYLGFLQEEGAGARKEYMERILDGIFRTNEPAIGQETNIISNSPYGDVFDVVYEDAGEAVLSKYELIISAKPDRSLSFLYPRLADRIIEANDSNEVLQKLALSFDLHMPIRVKGSLSWTLSSCNEGYILGFFNNNGVLRRADGERVLHEADTVVRIDSGHHTINRIEVFEGEDSLLSGAADGGYLYSLGAGECAVIRIF